MSFFIRAVTRPDSPFRTLSIWCKASRYLHHVPKTGHEFSKDEPQKDRGKGRAERWLALGAITLAIPALAWIYQHRQQDNKAKAQETLPGKSPTPVVITNLKQIDSALSLNDNDKHISPTVQASIATIMPTDRVHKVKYLVVGGGTAGFAAMEEIIRMGEKPANVLIVGDEDYPPYMRPPLSKELWFNQEQAKVSKLRFIDWHGEEKAIFYRPLGAYGTDSPTQYGTLIIGRKAVSLDVENKSVALDNGQVIIYEKLLIATGGRPKELPILKQIGNKQAISTFRTIKDLQHLVQDVLPKTRQIAIIGGGFLGSELAVALAQFSKNHLGGQIAITQMFPEDGNMALVFPRYLSRWTMKKIKGAGITVLPNTIIADAKYEEANRSDGPLKLYLQSTSSATSGNTLDSDDVAVGEKRVGRILAVDHAIVAIGIEPNVELARSGGLEIDDERGGIVTNAYLQASPDIYAAGDVISFHDPFLSLRRRVEHYDHAILSARIAAHNMVVASSPASSSLLSNSNQSSRPKAYTMQSMFWSDLGPEIGYEAIGLVDSQLTTVGVWAEAGIKDSPRGADLDPSDIRAQKIGDVVPRTADPIKDGGLDKLKLIIPSPSDQPYGKGVVFYVKDRRIVGLLMFNLFNRLELARDIIRRRHTVEDLETIVNLFNINEEK